MYVFCLELKKSNNFIFEDILKCVALLTTMLFVDPLCCVLF